MFERREAGGAEVSFLITAWLGGKEAESQWKRKKPLGRAHSPTGEGSQKRSELRRDEKPVGHLEKKGSSVLFLQGLLQLFHVTL